MYDHECTALLTSSAIYIYNSNLLVMVDERNSLTKLCIVNLGDKPGQDQTNHKALSFHPLSQSLFALGGYLPTLSTLSQRIAFYRVSLFSLVLVTLFNALDTGYITTRPELTFSLVRKYPPQFQVIVEDHLDQQCVDTTTSRSHDPRQIHLPPNRVSLSQDDQRSSPLS